MKPKTLFNFFFYANNRLNAMSGRILIVADDLKTAEQMVKKEDNQLALENNGTGWKIAQEIILNRDVNVTIELK